MREIIRLPQKAKQYYEIMRTGTSKSHEDDTLSIRLISHNKPVSRESATIQKLIMLGNYRTVTPTKGCKIYIV